MTKQLPLASRHLAQHAKMVDFHGWEMPLDYGSQMEEHAAVRSAVGLFDVSHMTVVDLLGTGVRQFLRQLLSNDVDRLTQRGEALYSCMLNHQGGVIDDLIVYYRAADQYRLILNSATRDQDLAWMQNLSSDFNVGIYERTEYVLLAVQGPKACDTVLSVLSPLQMDAVSTLHRFASIEIDDVFIARTGYTGEDGYEIMVPVAQAGVLWDALIEKGAKPCGLAARDMLRLEAGLMLYGQDMDESTTPYESALGWTVALKPDDRDFIGRAALMMQQQQGVKRQLVGLVCLDKAILRHGQKVQCAEGEGIITSGGYCPELKRSIAFARIPKTKETAATVTIRDVAHAVEIVKPRFYQERKYLVGEK